MFKRTSAFITLALALSGSAQADEIKPIFTTKSLTPEAALMVAQGAMKACQDSGAQVSVAVVDTGGNLQVVLRDRLAGAHFPEAAIMKAKTSLSFRSATTTLTQSVNSNADVAGIKELPGLLILGGGITVQASGSMVGAVGVAGAPDGKTDEKCALAGGRSDTGIIGVCRVIQPAPRKASDFLKPALYCGFSFGLIFIVLFNL